MSVTTDLKKRVVRDFMDILILNEIKKGMMSGYDVMAYLQKRFGVSLSSGTVYGTLYAMERENLIEGFLIGNKRVYRITENRDTTKLLRAYEPLQDFLRNTVSVNTKFR
ncbi:MAG: PadR family transcriptional regulator [Candidatus Bathyarchaeota archaeon]|nr:PadR family transcriptional regulator [Candidatus Bathyarchaeota archaeon]